MCRNPTRFMHQLEAEIPRSQTWLCGGVVAVAAMINRRFPDHLETGIPERTAYRCVFQPIPVPGV